MLNKISGLIAAAEIEPKVFKNAWLFHMLSGAVSAGVFSWILAFNPESIFSAIIMGGILGSTAPFWVNPYPITPLSTKSA